MDKDLVLERMRPEAVTVGDCVAVSVTESDRYEDAVSDVVTVMVRDGLRVFVPESVADSSPVAVAVELSVDDRCGPVPVSVCDSVPVGVGPDSVDVGFDVSVSVALSVLDRVRGELSVNDAVGDSSVTFTVLLGVGVCCVTRRVSDRT